MVATRTDSTYFATLAQTHHVSVAGDAGELIHNALEDLDGAGRSDKTLASYNGGRFAVKDFVRWLYAIDPRYAQSLTTANDSMINQLVVQLVQRSLALREADSSGVQPTDSELAEIRLAYDSSLAAVEQVLNLTPAMAHDSATTADGRTRLAMARVNDYFDRLVGGRTQFLPIPPLLTQVLRERGDWSIDAPAVQRAVERANALRASADSLRPAAGAQMQPAPGPPPVTLPDTSKPRRSVR